MGFFPLDRQLQLTKHSWTLDTIHKAIRLAVEISSYERAADCFEVLTAVPISRSSLQRLALEYGGRLVAVQAAEAVATVEPPPQFDEETFRQVPRPDSEVMATCMDGVLLNIRGEGWKEAKVVTISAVERAEPPEECSEPAEPAVQLTRHSYRAGLWDAATFGRQQWAEACRRGIEKAAEVVSINDGALWIWAIVQICFAPCTEILDWWHAVEKLWVIATLLFGEGNEVGQAWAKRQKDYLWAGDVRALFHDVRRRYPRGQPLPAGLAQPLGYFFANRHRMHYQQFRRDGYPVGSGSVESACKTVAQGRMKQAGMRWSRAGAQAMLALRSVILSGRWTEVWPNIRSAQKVA